MARNLESKLQRERDFILDKIKKDRPLAYLVVFCHPEKVYKRGGK